MVGCAVKLGDGPFEPLILLAIVGSVPKNARITCNSWMKSIRSEWINASGRNAAGFCFGGGLGRVERVGGRETTETTCRKSGGGPFEPLILLAIAGPVPKNTFSNSNSELQLQTPKIPIDG